LCCFQKNASNHLKWAPFKTVSEERMRWTPGGVSSDVEDRRGDSGGGFGGRGIGIGAFLILLVISLVTGRDLITPFLSNNPGAHPTQQSAPARTTPAEDREVQFVSFVLDDTQNTWTNMLAAQGATYRHAKLVLFRDYTQSACGTARAATGPFYCPPDERVYIDLGFFDQLRSFGASDEFAQAYVIAHEIGHHVQNLLGIERQVRQLQQRNPAARNRLSVAMELQADCLAGVWGHSTAQRNIIDAADVKAGLDAAAAVGDDRLQRMSTGTVSPESFTHGSSAERVQWFTRGLEQGRIAACNTFAAGS
jgi:uncharacterized protein